MSRRAVISATLLVALVCLAAAPAAEAARGAPKGTGIELVDGSGRVVLNLRGALLGGLERGQLTVVDLTDRQKTEIIVQGYKWKRTVNARTTVYGGAEIRFRVFRGAWRVRIQGSGIGASAVGRGTVRLKGRGLYSVAGGPYRIWPALDQTIRLDD
jgi:hypothetical protein